MLAGGCLQIVKTAAFHFHLNTKSLSALLRKQKKRTEQVHMALSTWRQTQQGRIRGWVMFILHCIPVSAVNRLLLHSAFPDENHMLNEGARPHQPCTWDTPTTGLFFFYPRTLHRWSREPGELWKRLGMAAKSSLFSCLPQARPWLKILREECLESWFGNLILSESPSLK